MVSALWAKEWKQLRLLQWTGAILGLVLPPAVIALAEAARRGVLPTGRVGDYSLENLFAEPMATLYLSLWALFALLASTQAFAADRGAGTDSFLLERPVSRRTLWAVKFAAAAASALLIAVVQLLSWAVLRQIVVGYGFAEWARPAAPFLALAAAACLIGLFSGMAAAPLVRNAMQAALTALALAALPFVIAALLVNISPMATIGPYTLGVLVVPLLPLLYVAASWDGETRGEPFGRRRRWRSARWLIAGSVASLVLFTLLVPPLIRASGHGTWSYRVGANDVAIQEAGYRHGLWWRDEASGERRFFPPPIEAAALSPDGRYAAIVDRSAPFGGVRDAAVLRLIDAEGRDAHEPLPCADCVGRRAMRWRDGQLLIPYGRSIVTLAGLLRVDPESGSATRLPFVAPLHLRLLGDDDRGRLLGLQCGELRSSLAAAPDAIDLRDAAEEHATLCNLVAIRIEGDAVIARVTARVPTYGWVVSATRFWREDHVRYLPLAIDPERSHFLDVRSNEVVQIETPGLHLLGLAADRRLELDIEGGALRVTDAAGETLVERVVPDRTLHARVDRSGRSLAVWARDDALTTDVWLVDVDRDSWHRLDELDRPDFQGWINWVGPTHLLAGGSSWIAVYRTDEDRWYAPSGELPWD